MSLSIGQQLKTARIDRNLSIQDVFENTHIRIKYLEALEADDYDSMPSPVQGRGFLRLYAQYLGLDAKAMLAEIQHQEQAEESFSKIEETFGEISPEVKRKIADTPNADAAPVELPLWRQFLARFGVTLASPVADSVQEQVPAPIAEPTPKSAPEALSEPPAKPLERYVPAPPLPPPTGESGIIFAEIGKTLRERREMLSLTYAEIEGHIHLRPHYMEALEAGSFASLPSPVQTRGMLTNYAEFLDLDTEALLLKFAEGLQAQRVERNLPMASTGSRKSKRRFALLGGFIAPDLIFGGGVILLMLAFTIWGLGRIANTRAEDAFAEATAPSIAEVLMSTVTPEAIVTPTETLVVVNTPDPNAGTEVAQVGDELPEGATLGVQILVTVLERSWMRVTVDGELVFEGRAQADATFVYEGTETVEVLTANGAGVRIAYNQEDMGLMGGFGEVVQRIYSPFGQITPTVTPTLPATATLEPTLTPTSTPTIAPTETQ